MGRMKKTHSGACASECAASTGCGDCGSSGLGFEIDRVGPGSRTEGGTHRPDPEPVVMGCQVDGGRGRTAPGDVKDRRVCTEAGVPGYLDLITGGACHVGPG